MGLIHTFASAPKRGCDMSSWLLSLFLACSLATATLAKESFKLENEKNFEGKEKRTINYEIPTEPLRVRSGETQPLRVWDWEKKSLRVRSGQEKSVRVRSWKKKSL